jgi:hypothetical protein
MSGPRDSELFLIFEALEAAEEQCLTDRLTAFNLAHSPANWTAPKEPQAVRVAGRDAVGALIGGLIGRTHAIPYWFEVSVR